MTLPVALHPKTLRNGLSHLILTFYRRLDMKTSFSRFLVQDTCKFDCTAQIKMREILFSPEHKVQ